MTSSLGLMALASLALAQDATGPTRDLPGAVMPDRHWDVVHLDLTLDLDLQAGSLTGQTVHTVRPLGNRHGTLRLHQVALDIQGVSVDGEPVDNWRIGRQTLDIPMPAEGDEHQVRVDYAATPQTGLHFRRPGRSPHPVLEVWSQGEDQDNRHWFPSWDHPSDRFTVQTTVTAPSALKAHANGVLKESNQAGDRTTWTYRLDEPIVNYLVALTVGDHQVIREEGQVPLEYIGASTHDAEFVRRGFDRAKPQMAYLADLLDEPFPYPVYRQVMVSGFLYGGMENASITIMSDRGLQPSDDSGLLRLEELTAHEIAHQWFGDLVTCYGWRELWLNEGFATFYTGRWMEHTRGPDYYAVKTHGWAGSAARQTLPMSPRGWSAVEGSDNAGVYVRGATVLHMLRVMLGNAVFDEAIRLYLDRHAGRLVETDDLRRAFEDVSGTHLGWFFDQWVHGVGIPAVSTSWSWSEGELVVSLDQDPGEQPPFRAPVELEIGTVDGTETRKVWLGEGQTRLVMPLGAQPDWVAVDPRGGLLADWTREQEPGAWAAQAQHSPSPRARIIALEHLGDPPAEPGAVSALVAVLSDDDLEPRLREFAAASLGALSTPEALAALNGQRDVADPYLREAVVTALGAVGPDPATLGWLERAARGDSDVDVRGAAIAAVADADSDRGAALARRILGTPDRSWQQEAHQSALQVLAQHGRTGDLGPLIARVDPRSPRSVWYRAAQAAVSRIQDDPDVADAQVRRLESALIRSLGDDDQRVREASVDLLGAIGEEAGEQALERFASTNEVVGLSERALDAAASIRTRSADTVSADDAEADVERLEQAIQTLEERIERLEDWR